MKDDEFCEVIKTSGVYAWIIMALGIVVYDTVAIKTNKIETMSAALWRSLQHPAKSPLLVGIWVGVTHHLFANKNARESYRRILANRVAK